MDFNTLLVNRRSIREFQDKPVPLALVKEIIHETRFAPMVSNRQPCRFIVIRDSALVKRLSDESKGYLLEDIRQNPA